MQAIELDLSIFLSRSREHIRMIAGLMGRIMNTWWVYIRCADERFFHNIPQGPWPSCASRGLLLSPLSCACFLRRADKHSETASAFQKMSGSSDPLCFLVEVRVALGTNDNCSIASFDLHTTDTFVVQTIQGVRQSQYRRHANYGCSRTRREPGHTLLSQTRQIPTVIACDCGNFE